MSVPEALSQEHITATLAELPGWGRVGEAISRTYPIRFHAGVATIVTIADRARRVQHHPDLDLRIDTIVAAHEAIPLD
ncbi:4a-hydroxytetrahydrobiopterin dehydratase [Streptomyces sp. BI20]|uniref:4a-hydroxytetrahydrobiopterin dehydratase n=1 Tax=Streptomyces sp. BI20 TaxID=3403460 RepID=UPI003C725F32